jgi:hypothetical protein
VTRVEHYKGLHTDLDSLYQHIKEELQKEKKLKMAAEFKGEMNGQPLRSITAVNGSPTVLAGALREITISILGNTDDYAVEVGSGSWFESLLIPGATGFVVGGPLGAAGGVAVGAVMAYEYERHIWKRIKDVIQVQSGKPLNTGSVDHYGK